MTAITTENTAAPAINTEFRVEGLTAAEWRERRAAAGRSRQESYETSDTDGFLSQWADGLEMSRCELNAQLAEQGGVWEFLGLFRVGTGERVPAFVLTTRYGVKWAICDEKGNIVEWLTLNGAENSERIRKNQEKKGYYEAKEMVPAKVVRCSDGGRGLSGRVWYAVDRLDGGYPGKPRRGRQSEE
jgi:hypothetical protein